jgi:transcription factor SPN1
MMSDSDHSLGISPSPENTGSPEHRDDTALRTTTDTGVDGSDDDLGDLESELSEVDEAEFADFDPTTVALDDRPQIEIDEDVARTLKAGKRKRTDKDGESGTKKPKEAKRDKPKKKKFRATVDAGAIDDGGDVYDSGADGEILEGKRKPKPKRAKIDGDGKDRERAKERRKEIEPEENEENLTPEERRRRALDRAMDAALKNPNKRRRKKDEVVRNLSSTGPTQLLICLGSRRSF